MRVLAWLAMATPGPLHRWRFSCNVVLLILNWWEPKLIAKIPEQISRSIHVLLVNSLLYLF